jgi:peroxiredoxin (alkyl hydroperoxide reductase subunit C)
MTAAATAVAGEKAQVGQPAPDFEMASTKNIEKLNEPVKLADYRGKWLVLVFYPLDFTFVCPTELTTFSDRYDDFVDIGADVIGISTDSVYSHRAWINTARDKGGVEGLKYPVTRSLRDRSGRNSSLQGRTRSKRWSFG